MTGLEIGVGGLGYDGLAGSALNSNDESGAPRVSVDGFENIDCNDGT